MNPLSKIFHRSHSTSFADLGPWCVTVISYAAGTVALVAAVACAGSPVVTAPVPLPAFLVGAFLDDYGARYEITRVEWVQLPRARYHIVRWDVAGQFAIAQNDPANSSDGGLWTRIDWLELRGMAPYTWGFCYSAYKAPSAAAAEAVTAANRTTPRTGCNGFPFSRMQRRNTDSTRSQGGT